MGLSFGEETSTFQTQFKSKFTTAVSQTLTKKKEFLLILGVAWLSPWTFWLKYSQQPPNWPQASWTHLQRATWLRYFIPCPFSWENGSSESSPPPAFIYTCPTHIHTTTKELLVSLGTESLRQPCWSQYCISGCVQTWISNPSWTYTSLPHPRATTFLTSPLAHTG